MAEAFELDESGFPLVVAVFRGPVQLAAFDAFVARLDSFCKERRSFSMIVDMHQGAVPSAGERKHIADALEFRREPLRRYCMGATIIITSPLIRGAMTAILWISPLPYPYEIATTIEAARSRCTAWLTDSPPLSRVR